ncbi:MAG: hypothetical protein NC180_06490 [Muribaculaceae bacterium]|nr:hypothetical protein [Roseburia sp.]MCM1429805.1 hypothetical protein [Muribaculaceae bacterium]MCM1492856.1 hypothetical protein [Muribaculaceae bacterium]
MSEALKNTHKYDDLIDRGHHVSKTHPQMPPGDRAAQFSPFAALSGYERVIRETGERHEKRMELGEGMSRETYYDKHSDR